MENQGLELSLFITPVNTSLSGEGKGFRWSIDPQLGQVINKLVNDVLNGINSIRYMMNINIQIICLVQLKWQESL